MSSLTGVVAIAILVGAAASTWKSNKGFNCYDGYGATEIDTYPLGSMSLADCKAKCEQTGDCTAVTVMMNGNSGNCWRRKNIALSKCQTDTEFDTWVNDAAPTPPSPSPAPPAPSGQFPTTVPGFMKAFVEGLLSDDGTDAKKCEGDVKAFAADMENLGHTAVGATKAVASAIEEAKQMCTAVAKDALKLAGSALGDVFHPGRIAKNYQATRTDVLSEIGYALEALAKKDFKGAGNNVGKFNRRLIEGPQAANSQPSSYTKLGDLNCYKDHGAWDLENITGQPCGEMALHECEQKCDDLVHCQGITAVPSKNGVWCYRRGNIKISECDHHVMGYNTFLNTNAQMPEAANTVATIGVYIVTYWGAAAMTQETLASESVEEWGDFLEGILEGLMSDGTDFSDCTATVPMVGQAVKAAREKIGKSLAATMAAAKIAKQSCGTVAGDVTKLATAAFDDLKHPDHVFQNFQDMQYGILMDLGKAFEALAVNNYPTAGNLMGMAIRQVIEGKQATTVVV